MIWPYIITAVIALIVGFLLGLWRGAKLGIRVFGHDAVILAIRTQDSNPDAFASMKAEALDYPDHEAWIQQSLEKVAKRKPKVKSVREEWEEEKKRLNDDGIY